jgi:phosphoserine phosphatase RsbU/P
MFSTILDSQQTQIEALAADWLRLGASSFSIWSDGVCLQSWSSDLAKDKPLLIQAIEMDAIKIGELRLTGLDEKIVQDRLGTQAGFIAQIVGLERDLNSMTADLIDTQDQLLALYELTQATRNFLEIDKTLARLALESTRLLKVEAAFFMVHMHDRPLIIQHYPKPLLSDELRQNYVDALLATDYGFLCRRVLEAEKEENMEARDILLVPIKVRNANLAVIGLLNKVDGEFTSPDIKLAQAVAEFTGAQIENVIMYQLNMEQAKFKTEMDLAKRIQDHLLPQKQPTVPGLDLWAASESASRVGGDFYDFITHKDQPFTFSVGDISGKGIPAALLMAMTRTVIRTKTHTATISTPQVILSLTNEELYDDFTQLSMFATVFVGQYDPQKRQLIYANAGHSPVIYCPVEGEARLLQADGTPIGVLPTSLSQDQFLTFLPGDVLVVATDGFSEARNTQGKEFGYDELVTLVQSLVHLPGPDIARKLREVVAEFSAGEQQADDQTLVVLKGVHT